MYAPVPESTTLGRRAVGCADGMPLELRCVVGERLRLRMVEQI
jgi:hypothetical protein